MKWIKDGGLYEDIPTWMLTYLRSVNHFHNPLTDQGYSGPWYTFGIVSGLSSTQWMVLPQETQSPGGYYSWHDVRNYYYKALTSSDQNTRDTYFAETFRGLGQLMHLIQDASVPAHTRNDFHVLYNYEKWVKTNEDGIFKHNPVFFNGSISNASSFIDTNQYNGTNPGITTSATMGISEYTNANFFSEDTINASNFPYPTVTENTQIVEKAFINTLWNETYPRRYYLKDCCGETKNGQGYLLSAVDYLDYYRREYPYLSFLLPKIPVLDNNIYTDYASLLLPRAIGYSAGFMKYFFRGELEVVQNTYSNSITITNNSPEKMEGTFTLYYDAADGTRKSVTDSSWSLTLEAGETSNQLSFTEPIDLAEDKPYILVFEGTLGSESDAVVGKIGFCTEELKLTATDAAKGNWFGYSVTVSGDVAVIGASLDDDAESDAGAVYAFIRSGEKWEGSAQLTASDATAGDNFGYSVAVNGDVAIVGAPWEGFYENDTGYWPGAAYIFVRNGERWEERAKLTASDDATENEFGPCFGWSVAISGDVAIIGSPFDEDAGDFSGSAYVFVRNGDMWVQKKKLTANDAAAYDFFGYSVAIDGDIAIVGSLDDDSAHVFAYNGVTWEKQVKLTPSDTAVGDEFGISVAISGDVAIVGADEDDDAGGDSGSAYVFVRNGNTWEEKKKLTASDAAAGDRFGWSVAVSGDVAIVGSTSEGTDYGDWSGSAYIKYYNGCSP